MTDQDAAVAASAAPAAADTTASASADAENPGTNLVTTGTTLAVLPATPESLVVEAVHIFPALEPVQALLGHYAVAYANYVVTAGDANLALSRQEALDELALTLGITEEMLRSGYAEIYEALRATSDALSAEFLEETGEEVDAAAHQVSLADATTRYDGERQEQDSLRARALELLALVKTVSGQLGIPNPDLPPASPETVSPVVVAEVRPALRLGGMIRGALQSAGTMFVEPGATPAPAAESEVEETQPASLEVGWKTPPVLTEEDPDIRLLGVIARRAAQQADVQAIWAILNNLQLTQSRVQEVLRNVAKKARAQMAQSDQIMTSVFEEFGEYRHDFENLEQLRSMIEAVMKFFFSRSALNSH